MTAKTSPISCRKNVFKDACPGPYRTLILDGLAGKPPSSTLVGVLSSDAVDNVQRLRLPAPAGAR